MKKFNIGDRVKVEKLSSYYERCGDNIGKIIDNEGDFFGIEFEENIRGHDANGKGKFGYCWYVHFDDLYKCDTKIKNKLKNLEIDPFEEEDWGHVQENLKLIDFKNSYIRTKNIEEWNFLMNYLENNTKCIWADKSRPTKLSFFEMYPDIFIDSNFIMRRTRDNIVLYLKFKTITIDTIKEKIGKKKLKNIDIDPFEEEDWGFDEN